MKLKLPSLHALWLSFLRVVARFPLQAIVALAASIAWCYVVDIPYTNPHREEQLMEFLAVCNLALTLLLAADLYAEVNHFGKAKQWSLRLLMVLLCAGLYFLLKPYFYLADMYRLGLLAFAFHLLVAFAPFIGKGSLNGFWQYNKSLFLRILTSGLYAVVLFAGLAIALGAIDGLFNVKIGWQTYMRLFAVVSAGFMTIFFLAGVPDDFDALNKEESYPKGLKIFTQYVLIPLMTIYLVILLVYEVKIMLSWQLPKGLVSTLILGYAVFGILSLLLVYPIKEKEGNGWMKLFSRFFYVMMIPLVILLLLAVWKRVGVYGITESRYILVVLALWLTIVTLYFLVSKKQNIKIIPVSLCILALLATYGPQSAFSVSRYSQVARLKKLMASKKDKDIKERGPVVSYLVDRHGLAVLQPFTKRDLREIENKIEKNADSLSRYSVISIKTDTANVLLNIKYDPRNSYIDSRRFETETGTLLPVSGYDYVVAVENYLDKQHFKVNGVDVTVEKTNQYGNLKLKVGTAAAVEYDVRKLARDAVALYKAGKLKGKKEDLGMSYMPSEGLSITKQVGGLEIKLVITLLNTTTNTTEEEELNKWLSYNGYLLVGSKR
ncbi:DUF4153 domain-containing protein [Pedobacter africanus]|uniref:DUF4153 domain-containing protein n=1 Tax=Pedobacter africanus TaxID=151894 RepID=A0A1W2BGH8_9SPHI|nr:DUF4153 domain-containing protein [Pedobacter africanus]SMC72039.1 protein of unknown function [Pedobacter africanus]